MCLILLFVAKIRAQVVPSVDKSDLVIGSSDFHAALEKTLATILLHSLFSYTVAHDALSLSLRHNAMTSTMPGYRSRLQVRARVRP